MTLALSARAKLGLLTGLLVLVVLIIVGICSGAATVESLTLADPVLRLRLPRVFLAALVGGALGMSGAASQALLRNPLAEPGTLGIGMGAAAGAAFVVVILGNSSFGGTDALQSVAVSAGAFVVALVAALCVVVVASMSNSTLAPILTGLALSAVSNAFLGTLTVVANDFQLRSLAFWTLGSLGAASPTVTMLAALLVLPGLVFLGRQARALNAMLLGDAVAASLGVDVKATRTRVIVWSSLLAAAAIAPCGFIAFTGMLAPHAARLVVGSDQRVGLPLAALLGGALVVVADTIARTVVAPAEFPVGVLTSMLGAPLFALRIFSTLRRAV